MARDVLSAEAEVESLRNSVAKHFEVYGVLVTPLALTFQVRAPHAGIDGPFDALRHDLVPQRYSVRASLPFFLPSIPPLGTLGAFISMRDPIANRRALLDIGVSGPLVGFAIAIPVTLAGLALSTASASVAATGVGEAIRPSILFSLLSLFFPLPSSFALHPLAFAGWVGLFVTAINLLPA